MMIALVAAFALASQDVDDHGIKALIEQLSSEDVNSRDGAEARLVRLGSTIEPRIGSLLSSPDGEIRARAQSILEQIKLDKIRAMGLESSNATKLKRCRFHGDNRAYLAPDGRHLIALWTEAPTRLPVLDIESGKIVRSLQSPWVQEEGSKQPCYPHLLGVGTEGRVVGTCILPKPTSDAYWEALVWDYRSGNILKRHTLPSCSIPAVSPDGRRVILAQTGKEWSLSVLDLDVGKSVVLLAPEAMSAPAGNTPVAYFSGDGARAICYWADRTLRVFDVATAKELKRFEWRGDAVMASGPPSPDGKFLILPEGDRFKLLETDSGRTSPVIKFYLGPIRVSFSRDGRDIAFMGGDHRRILISGAMSGDVGGRYGGDEPESFGQVTPDGKSVMACGRDGTIRFWDLAGGKEARVVRPPKTCLLRAALSPDGRILASAMSDDTVRLWDSIAGKEVHRLAGHANVVEQAAFSPDGKLLASAGADRSVRLWEVATGRDSGKLEGHESRVRRLAFSSDGRTLVSADCHSRLILFHTKIPGPA